MLLPILDSVQHLQAIALARSLVHHNTGTQMNLVLASDLAGLRRLLGPLDEAMRASKADGVRVHVLAVERLPDVASAVWLATQAPPPPIKAGRGTDDRRQVASPAHQSRAFIARPLLYS